MKTTLIGHACLWIESKDTTMLCDPCLFSIHFEELNHYYPKVEIDREKLKRPDVLYLSHRHQDHFDIRTLAYLPKDLKVFCPQDPLMLECLKELGYSDVTAVESFESYTVKGLTLIPTPSLLEDYYPEHGVIVRDGEVSIWNQVDTIVSPKIIEYIHRICGRVDLAHLRFQPLLEQNFAFHKPCVLPFEEYSSFLKVAKALSPKFAVPGSAGERFFDRFDFLNHFVFPTTQEQFLEDLREFAPEIQSSVFNPGDIAEITKEGVTLHEKKSETVKFQENNDSITAFNPLMEVPRIRTMTTDPARQAEEKQCVENFLQKEFLERLQQLEVASAWGHWKVGYRLELFGEDDSDVWSIDFSKPPAITRGYLGRVNVYEGISYSELYRLIKGETNWDFVGASGQYRTFHNVYRVVGGNFECFPQEKKFPQPLMEVFPPDKAMDREKYLKDVRRWKGQFEGN
ncbi:MULTISPECIES: MBL fold metallo-hydrolase [unclassified Nitrospina]|uniref:MBL fold metallo-hydrolase n=1 Tax=unclassified Nitrospina TaxID=2638683 RepID=UPI003F94FFBE